MTTQEKLYTVEEFWEITQQPENQNKRLELISGTIVEMASSSKKNTVLAARLVRFLGAYVDERDLGYVTGADSGYQLGQNTVRQPDAACISFARARGLEGNTFSVGPDLAVEVISPSETPRSLLDKIHLYFQAGTLMVWVIDPDTRKVDVYRPAESGELRLRTLGLDDTLDGGEAIPGFTLSIRELFAVLDH